MTQEPDSIYFPPKPTPTEVALRDMLIAIARLEKAFWGVVITQVGVFVTLIGMLITLWMMRH